MALWRGLLRSAHSAAHMCTRTPAELLPGFLADGSALFLEESRSLVVSDLHIGYEEESREEGVLLLNEQRAYLQAELRRLIERHNPSCVIINGDVKHAFGRISEQEWSDVTGLISALKKMTTVRIIGGNHDTLLAPILRRVGLALEPAAIIGDTLVVHGDATLEELVEKKALRHEQLAGVHTIVCGHEHPALRLSDGVRVESLKCFLVGKLGEKTCIVTPAFTPHASGIDVLREEPLGPLLSSFDGFTAFGVIEGSCIKFGPVEQLRALQT
ncbi:metallophosphoesterase [Candidatus Woesearchaeota archaeon]|nr:MAG: metallophosphoesterase [Candidatus Woesearchaeota archaeon]